jgi:hypothetical protein
MNAVGCNSFKEMIVAGAANMQARMAARTVSQELNFAKNVPVAFLNDNPLETGSDTPQMIDSLKSGLENKLPGRDKGASTTEFDEKCRETFNLTDQPASTEKAQTTHSRATNTTNAQPTSSSESEAIEVSQITRMMIIDYKNQIDYLLHFAKDVGIIPSNFDSLLNNVEALQKLKEEVKELVAKNTEGQILKGILVGDINRIQELGREISVRVEVGL